MKTISKAGRASALSTTEILNAPADDYMSERQLAFFYSLLCSERDALLGASKDTQFRLQNEESGSSSDPSDRASVEEEHSLELRVRDREWKQLRKIDQALARIADASYGWCIDSGEPIGVARMLARPTAVYSLEAQERYELLEKRRRG